MIPEGIKLEVYQAAVMDNPRKHGEGPLGYVARIAGIVAGTEPGVVGKAFPEPPRLPYKESA